MDTMTNLLNGAHVAFFNFYDFLLLAATMQCVVFAVFFATYKKKPHIHSVFAAFVLVIGLGQLNFFITYNLPILTYLATSFGLGLFNVTALVFYLQGVLLYEYVRTITRGRFQLDRFQWVPLVIFSFVFFLKPVTRFEGVLADVFWRDYVFTATVGFAVSAVYGGLALRHLKAYSRQLENHISSMDKFNPEWLMFVCKAFLLVWILELLPPFFYGRVPFVFEQIAVHIKDVVLLGIISYVVLSSLTYGQHLRAIPDRDSETKKPEADREEEAGEIQLKIEAMHTLMAETKLYKKHNLTIEAFSAHLNVPVKDVSQLLNVHAAKNFYEFVNSYRIEEAKALLRSETHKSVAIQQIYEEVGFHSKSSFNTLFKKMVGTTPSRFRKNLG